MSGWFRHDLVLAPQPPHLGIELACVRAYLFLLEDALVHLRRMRRVPGEPRSAGPQQSRAEARAETPPVRTSFWKQAAAAAV